MSNGQAGGAPQDITRAELQEAFATQVALLVYKMDHLAANMVKLEKKLDDLPDKYVTKAEFSPVQRIVYGMVGIILVAVFSGLVALVVQGVP